MSESAIAPQDHNYPQLISRIRAGDAGAMDELYLTLRPGLRWMVCRSVGPHDTDDIVQDVFLTAFRMIQRGAVEEPEHLIAYVRGIARNHILSCIHSRVAQREHQVDFEPAVVVKADHKPNPEEVLQTKEYARLTRDVLAKMPSRKREVLVRFYLNCQSPEQICHDLGLTATQFRLLKNRAKDEFGKLGRRLLARKPPGHAILRPPSLQLQTCSDLP